MNTAEVTVWYEGACSTFGAPEMSLTDGFVHDDNSIDWADPDDGIYWTRACVYLSPTGEGGEARYAVVAADGTVLAEAPSVAEAQVSMETLEAEGGSGLRVVETAAGERRNDLEVFHRRTRLISGEELVGALAVEVRGVRVLEHDEASERRCGLSDVTFSSLMGRAAASRQGQEGDEGE